MRQPALWAGLTRARGAFTRAARGVAAVATAAALGGCALLGGSSEEAAAIFDLTAPQTIEDLEQGASAQVLVPVPGALAALDTDRIVVRPMAAEIQYLSGSRWSDRLPALVQVKLVETFENSDWTGSVGRPGQSLSIDYRLLVDIRAFEYLADMGATFIDLSVRLLDDLDGRVLASRNFSAASFAASEAPVDIVASLDQTFDIVAEALVRWTVQAF